MHGTNRISPPDKSPMGGVKENLNFKKEGKKITGNLCILTRISLFHFFYEQKKM